MARSLRRGWISFGAALIALVALASSGCGESPGATAPDQQALRVPSQILRRSELGPAIAAKERHTDPLLGIPGVVGVAVGATENGQPAVTIFTQREGIPGLPHVLDGVPVAVEVTGEIAALRGPPVDVAVRKGGFSTTSVLPLPVPIGVSTGNEDSCSAGTISARVKKGSAVYALSNNHVYALENTASPNSQVLQPGLYDTGCIFNSNNVIGTLSDYVPIVFSTSASNTVDAAIALSSTAALGNSTPPNGYGTPSSSTTEAFVGQAVQKYGRSTSLTTGTVTYVDVTVNVGYDSGTARFDHQIIVQSRRAFIKAGDSGSLLVEQASSLRPVGLIFAGNSSGTLAVANPIDLVLGALSVTIDGS